MARHECPDCETVFLHTERCPGCGWSAAKAAKGAPKPTETHAPAKLPTYPAAAPGDDALIRAEMARWRDMPWMRSAATARGDEPTRALQSRLGLEPISPQVRAEVARLAALAAGRTP